MVTDVPFEPGSSPLVRGALPCPDLRRQAGGIIPARAGSTGSTTSTERGRRDHPRSCGEHGPRAGACSLPTGSSPLVRGALICIIRHTRFCRIIPARAGSTLLFSFHLCASGDHPRSCGEHYRGVSSMLHLVGSSPLVRGALPFPASSTSCQGIIPARAGSTLLFSFHLCASGDHPRSCGEHCSPVLCFLSPAGSSPLVRGALYVTLDIMVDKEDHPRSCGEHPLRRDADVEGLGITPARAGSTGPSSTTRT